MKINKTILLLFLANCQNQNAFTNGIQMKTKLRDDVPVLPSNASLTLPPNSSFPLQNMTSVSNSSVISKITDAKNQSSSDKSVKGLEDSQMGLQDYQEKELYCSCQPVSYSQYPPQDYTQYTPQVYPTEYQYMPQQYFQSPQQYYVPPPLINYPPYEIQASGQIQPDYQSYQDQRLLPLQQVQIQKKFKKFADVPFTGDDIDQKWQNLEQSGILQKLKDKLIAQEGLKGKNGKIRGWSRGLTRVILDKDGNKIGKENVKEVILRMDTSSKNQTTDQVQPIIPLNATSELPFNATVSDGTSIQKPLTVGETVQPLKSPDSLEPKEKEDKK